MPIVSLYKEQGLLREISSVASVDEVWAQTKALFEAIADAAVSSQTRQRKFEVLDTLDSRVFKHSPMVSLSATLAAELAHFLSNRRARLAGPPRALERGDEGVVEEGARRRRSLRFRLKNTAHVSRTESTDSARVIRRGSTSGISSGKTRDSR
eukprot:3699543-Rhodomonas_salina.3